MVSRTKRDPKLLKAFDVCLVLGRYVSAPTVEATAHSLSAYFRGGGRSIPYEATIEQAISVLFDQADFSTARKLVEELAGETYRACCLQVFDAVISKYKGRVSTFALIPSRLVGVGPGIGIRMPSALLTKVEGVRRFVLFQPRRGRGPKSDRAGLLLSMFNEKHAVNEEFGLKSEMLDMQCYARSKERELKILRSEDIREFKKDDIDRILGIYTAAMRRLITNPKQYGVSEDVTRDWHPVMDDYWF
jgi:hypothetical protein